MKIIEGEGLKQRNQSGAYFWSPRDEQCGLDKGECS